MNKSFEIINNVFLFFTGILFISFGYFLFESSIVGTKIKTLILFCIFLILILFFFLNKKIKNLFVKILLLIFTISLIGFESFGIFALNEASNVVSKITDYNSENTKKYSIIVRKDSKYKNISDIKGKNVYISQNISKKDFD
ncbi:MAG: hypothetical protein MRZ81_04775, partial [Peptoniphilaceae bacterium]|nr:hypothetical protein [Peptoniphilaceae bacterium]